MTVLHWKVFALFDRRERRQLVWVGLSMLVMAVFSTIGIAAILPFMSLLANPEVIQQNRWLGAAYEYFGFHDTVQFLFATGVATLAILLLSNGLRALTDWKILRFVRDTQHRLSRKLLAQYLSEPYEFFLHCNTSKLSKNILSEVNKVMTGVVVPVMRGVAQGVVALFIVALLVSVDPTLALFVSLGLGSFYGIIYLAIRREQGRLGREWVAANGLRYKVASEAFGGIKDVKVLGRERHFLDRFEPPSRTYARAVAANELMVGLPRYALEVVAFGGILIIILYLLGTGHQLDRILPLLSLYAFAAYRLMPSLQDVFMSVTKIRFHAAALDELLGDLARGEQSSRAAPAVALSDSAAADGLVFTREVRLNDVAFSYPATERAALRGINLVLRRNATVGLVGPTGSGKTTLVDLILGLYLPTSGNICIDDVELSAALLPAWRHRVGYVPQQIYLSDDSILNNIAFGVPAAEIDLAAAERAARMAQLHDFVQTLPQKYETVVGERGIRLSGGQRQRIGIARALYHDPDVLVMDEATSSLDTLTEEAVMDAIRTLSGKKTMILVAHRLSTVRDCDVVYLLERGQVTGCGSYDQLRRTHAMFRAMTGESAAVTP